MNYLSVLTLLEEFEYKMGLLYETFSKNFVDNAEVRSMFDDISSEEFAHRDIVKYQRRVMSHHEKRYENAAIDTDMVSGVIKRLDEIIANNGGMTLEESLRLAIELESSACERLYNVVAEHMDPGFSKLVEAMNVGCRNHVNKLKDYEESHYA